MFLLWQLPKLRNRVLMLVDQVVQAAPVVTLVLPPAVSIISLSMNYADFFSGKTLAVF